ncbi:MAG TPA: alpha/beta hydrolase [Baekduia sp.]|uniref:alpha/beta fold hydrolase n=1 Tax=Baekduia sp. TaxID=2600305 RepID=UPI002CE270A8|nr:alpha/beta hydrolase [Baekduia sp.]HMJ36912.1 alpha/beta hydrolase [Baekduia sp.]
MTLFQERSGSGTPVVLLHGLTATHRYVVMGSKALERSGHEVLSYDARGHGASDPAPEGPDAYTYADLTADLVRVLDEAGFERAVLAGASMGAHTALRVALEQPERVAGLVVVTPAYDPEDWPGNLARWDALSDGLRTGGVEGFVEAYGDEGVGGRWRDTIQTVLRQRLGAHEHPEAVADALRAVPRSRPFADRAQLKEISAPTVVVADRDEPDPGHPLAVGELYASLIPGARLVVEDAGQSPIAWQGAQLSKVIAEVAAAAQQQT